MREKWNKIHEAIFKDFDEDSIIGPSGIYLRGHAGRPRTLPAFARRSPEPDFCLWATSPEGCR